MFTFISPHLLLYYLTCGGFLLTFHVARSFVFVCANFYLLRQFLSHCESVFLPVRRNESMSSSANEPLAGSLNAL